VTLLGDGRRAKEETPQERSAAVLADLAKYGENKLAIVEAGGVPPLVAMLSLDACVSAQTHSSGAIFQLAALGGNREAIVKAGGITQLVALLSKGSPEAKKYSAGALWHLNSVAENKEATFNAGAIPPLVAVLNSKSGEAREYASGVLSILARTQGGTKAAIAKAGGIAALVKLLADVNMVTQRHSACALWGLSDGKDGIYDKEITKCGAVQPLIELLQDNNPETRGFAAACLLCLCNDPLAKQDILEQGGAEPLLAFAHGPPSWLSKQCTEMLGLLNVPLGDPDSVAAPPRHYPEGCPEH
jgi:vacuolar protein 8